MIAVTEHKRVLVIDNDDDTLDVMNEALTFEGFKMTILSNTDNIFPDISVYKRDIIIHDYILNGVNGGEICHQIKNTATTAQLPVVIMSAYPRVINYLGNYGCNAFIATHFDLEQIINCINSLTSAKQPSHLC